MKSETKVDLAEALCSISPAVRDAFTKSHEALLAAGIPHILIGGLAVNAHGYYYSTKDVDYLVRAHDAFVSSAGVMRFRPEVPFRVNDVAIDYLTPDSKGFPEVIQRALDEALDMAEKRSDLTAVIPDWLLVYMKLSVGRLKDQAAVTGLIQAGLDVPAVRSELVRIVIDRNATETKQLTRVLSLFDRCIEAAASE